MYFYQHEMVMYSTFIREIIYQLLIILKKNLIKYLSRIFEINYYINVLNI